jgi:hypothetical protein
MLVERIIETARKLNNFSTDVSNQPTPGNYT